MDPLSVVNLGLGWLGVDPLASFADSGAVGRRVASSWEGLRDAVLEDRDWSFATQRRELNADPTAPLFDFPYRYEIPSDVIRVIGVWPGTGNDSISAIFTVSREEIPQSRWQIEAGQDSASAAKRYILADPGGDTVRIKAVVRVEDSTLWTPGFCQALAARIAADLCTPITQNRALAADLWNLYQQKLTEAAAMDGRQGSHVRTQANWFKNRRV